jgi:hypothetical protein
MRPPAPYTVASAGTGRPARIDEDERATAAKPSAIAIAGRFIAFAAAARQLDGRSNASNKRSHEQRFFLFGEVAEWLKAAVC